MIKPTFTPSVTDSPFKNRRAELISRLTEGINARRLGTKWKPETTRRVAIRVNSNKFLAKDDGELELLIKECESKDNFKKFYWCCPLNTIKK